MTELRNIQADLSRFRLRVLIIAIVVVVAFGLVAARLVYLQVFRHEDLAEQAESNRTAIVPIVPNRGLILDRNGVVLATNYSAYTLEITPSRVADLEQTIDALSKVVDIHPRDRRRFKKLQEESRSFESLPIRTKLNDDEVADFAALTKVHPWHVRFIELMPVGELRELTWDHVVPSDELLARVRTLGALEPDAGPARGNGPAVYWRFADAPGSIGVITPMTHTYCERCNRVRLTADGRLRTCLFGDHEVLLRDALRAGNSLEPLFRQALAEKPKEHNLLQMRVGGLRALSEVGG